MTNPANTSARAATVDDVTAFRAGGQFSKIGLAILTPPVLWTAQINQTFESLDAVYQLTYDNEVISETVDWTYTHATLWVGATFGGKEKGICRVRVQPNANVLGIAPTSHIQFADNDYLTIVRDYSIWQREPTRYAMDWDILYPSIINGGTTLMRVGATASVIRSDPLTGIATFTPPDPTQTQNYDAGADELTFTWQYYAPGSASSTGMDTTAPSWTYDAPGQYLWYVHITDSKNRPNIAYRWIFVDPPELDFEIESNPKGSWSNNGWSFGVTLHSQASFDDVTDRALVVLYADDYYDGGEGSIGKVAGYENILCIGWIAGESIRRNPETSSVTFTVYNGAWWLSKIQAYPFELVSVTSANSWREITDMTVDKALARILFFMTTAPYIMDCFLTGIDTPLNVLAQPASDLLAQLNSIATDKVFARPLVNNYNQLYIQRDVQMQTALERASVPVVVDITSQDWIGSVDVERNQLTKTAMVELSGIGAYDGATLNLLYSRAPGSFPLRYGAFSSYNNFLFTDQDECNFLCGALLAAENVEYEPIDLQLAANNRLFDIAPAMVARLTLADSLRGLNFVNVRIIPREVEFSISNNVILTNVSCEFEATGVPGVTYIPQAGSTDGGYEFGDFGGVDFPSSDLGDFFPPVVPDTGIPPCTDDTSTRSFSVTWDKNELRGDDEEPIIARAYFPCIIRETGSSVLIRGSFLGDSPGNFAVYAVKNGERVLTATIQQETIWYRAQFSALSPTVISGFEIELEPGLGSSVTYEVGEDVTSGTISATDSGGTYPATIEGIKAGELYTIDGAGGPWLGDETADPQRAYTIQYSTVDPVAWSFAFGYRQIVNGGEFVWVGGGTPLYEERIYPYGRRWFYALEDGVLYVRVGSSTFGDNSGTMGYIVRKGIANGRRIILNESSAWNVCAAS